MVVPVSKAALGKFQVPINPQPDSTKTGESLVVPHGHFCHVNGTTVKSFSLVLSVRYPLNGSPVPNGYCNGDVDSEAEEPPHKRRRNGQITQLEEKDFIHYSTELVIYDRYGQCQLTDGDYKLILYEQGNKSNASWESVMEGKPVGSFEIFNYYPTLHMTLCWRDEVKQEPDFNSGISTAHNEFLNNNQYSSHFMSAFSSGNNNKENNQLTPKKRQRIFYQFLYNNNAKQQTEARDDMHCPWCFINCMEPYSLFKHLRLSHGRFNFIYVPHPKGYRVDVSINERYDGSYAGNPQDLHSHIGYAFSRRGPVRRTPVTHILVYRPKRPESSLSEFMEQENDMQTNKQFVQGHNRLYYHSLTCEPMKPQDVDVDSEDENDPAWLRKKSVQMIDEFTDVNEGEKELMKLWNLLIMKYNYIADCQIPEACQKFVEEHGQELICKNLYRNFIVHLINLFDFSLIRPDLVHRTVSMLDDLKEEIGVS
ncbi:hypothetical protein FSP39_018564 [Pinctada imbricata]|uniref:Polycomb protein VEFS-Box domain-containing protein n=1 Tax=Pinctada imbricata TaxID=66713 RepID=A0AA88Y249_PINIB|nr:hypothetical protein FSP39_018564 [Pinctada imbricata]